jgi:hypothetical protein
MLQVQVRRPESGQGRDLGDRERRGHDEGRKTCLGFFGRESRPGNSDIDGVLGVNLLGDWMRDYFDPKLSEAR